MRFFLAVRVFFKALFNRTFAQQLDQLLRGNASALTGQTEPTAQATRLAPTPARPPAPQRSEALTLLATLQREARFVDMVQEPLAEYSDAQVGAAARDVLRDCGKVIDRLFAIKPLVEQSEGEQIEVEDGFDTGCYRLTGAVAGEPPFVGKLVHHGWSATECRVPQWSGSEQAVRVVAPAEVELK